MMKERFVGVAVSGFIVGGGYEGKTAELDAIVEKEAEILERLFDKDIQIRFNSDRESGGAWLTNSLGGFGGNCQVGLCAGIHNGTVGINTYIDSSALVHPEIATEYYNTKAYTKHATLEEAEQWLIDNIDKTKLHS